MVQGLIAGIGQEPVEDAGEVLEMESGGGCAAGTFPKEGVWKGHHEGVDLFPGLEQDMGGGLK